ncbi:MAG: thioredoxin family protein [Chitinophagaceae bacterium]|nr:thioredoxin family protein [Chitinophagaceae bacterium]
MKRNIIILSVLIILSSCSNTPFKNLSKVKYTTTRDEGHEGNSKIAIGIINRSVLENDTAFHWLNENYKFAKPDDANAVNAFEEKKDKFQVLIFGGTWCEDTKNLLPLFYKLADKSNYSEKNILLVAVDRTKVAVKDLHKKYNLQLLPTFIVLRNGIEVGRVVEYGKTGAIDKELGEIVSKIE